MTALVGPLHIVCCVLAIAGTAKLISPRPTRSAIHAVGVRVPLVAVRALGVAEIVLGVGTIVGGGTVGPILVGALHLGFAVFVLVGMRSATAASCGCFGSSDAPPSMLHVVVVVVSAAVAFSSIGTDGLGAVLDETPGNGLAHMVWVAVGAASVIALLTALPALAHRGPRVAEFDLGSRR